VSFQLSISDRVSDMYRQPVDIAIRYGVQEDSSLIAFPLAPENRRVLVASPEYIKQHGKLASLDELARHNCLRFMLEDVIHDRWSFYRDADAEPKSCTSTATAAWTMPTWCGAGRWRAGHRLQIAARPERRHPRRPLQVLLPDVLGERTALNMLCMHRSQVTPTVLAAARLPARAVMKA
jgi:hypothetical protein